MRLIISNIDWAYKEKTMKKECPPELPGKIIIDDPILVAHLSKNIDGDAEKIAEYLSSIYHCGVCGFVPKIEKSIPKLTISNIEWDKDDNDADLPVQLVIDNPTSFLLEDINGEAENIANYLSDAFGYCVCGFTIDLEEVEEK